MDVEEVRECPWCRRVSLVLGALSDLMDALIVFLCITGSGEDKGLLEVGLGEAVAKLSIRVPVKFN